MVRLFKRFYFKTIELKYGYMKASANDLPEISSHLFCQELDLNPNILKLFGVNNVFKKDVSLTYVIFLQLMAIFYLRKSVIPLRLDFLLKIL
jgi:hypothetical protein